MTGVVVNGRKYTGKVVFRDANTLGILRRDGSFSAYPAGDVDLQRNLNKPFGPYSRDELENRLRAEFRSGYSLAFTDHFVVVFPTQSTFAWSSTFERLYRQFRFYFEARGYELTQPEFPLIAVVLRSRAEFDRELEATGAGQPTDIDGYYSIKSNRIVTYDQAMSDDSVDGGDARTRIVIHEATHQAAFNSGIHNRFRPVPRWVSEGLATMFEAPGVYNSVKYSRLEDRLSVVYRSTFQSLMDSGPFRGKLKTLICSDEWFDSDADGAYAMAWGLSFFLAENRPDDYQRYLKLTTRREDFAAYSAEQRLKDFCAVFGDDLGDLESRIKQYFDGLKSSTAIADR